jgi:hypothetical protein
MSYYTYNGLGQITQAAAGYGAWVGGGGHNVPGIGAWVGGGGHNVPGIGFGELFFEGGSAYWRVKAGGEIVSSIAQKVYGDATVWTKICAANPQDRDPQQPKGDCWYKPGAILKLPLVPGYPDPMATAPKSGLPVAQEGSTIVSSTGKVVTVGAGGKIGALASLSTPMKIGLGVAAAAAVLGIAVLASKKKRTGGGGQVIPITSARKAAANW